MATGNDGLKLLNFAYFTDLVADGVTLKTFLSIPDFTFLAAAKGLDGVSASYVLTVAGVHKPVKLKYPVVIYQGNDRHDDHT